MNTQSQNQQANQAEGQKEVQTPAQSVTSAKQNTGKKKYHKSALYASTLIRDSVGHVKPHNHSGIDL